MGLLILNHLDVLRVLLCAYLTLHGEHFQRNLPQIVRLKTKENDFFYHGKQKKMISVADSNNKFIWGASNVFLVSTHTHTPPTQPAVALNKVPTF
jgi:hypothetical protein